jgi:hypothetical protein
MPRSIKFNRLIVAGIAAAAISPTAALASPAIDGGLSATGSSVAQDLRAPDQVDGSAVVATTKTSVADGDGVDGGVLIAIGGGALLLVGGIGLAGRKRLQPVRQRQPA